MASAYNLDSGFLLLYDWLPALDSLSGDDYKLLLTSLIRYQREGEAIPEFENPIMNIFSAMIVPTLKRRADGKRNGKKSGGTRSRDCVPSPDVGKLAEQSRDSRDNISLSGESDIRARTREKAAFVPPTVEEIRAYCKGRGRSIDAEKFIAHYEANGWLVGGSPMVDWKAAVRKWEKNEGVFAHVKSAEGGTGHSGSFDTDDFFRASLAKSYAGSKKNLSDFPSDL